MDLQLFINYIVEKQIIILVESYENKSFVTLIDIPSYLIFKTVIYLNKFIIKQLFIFLLKKTKSIKIQIYYKEYGYPRRNRTIYKRKLQIQMQKNIIKRPTLQICC